MEIEFRRLIPIPAVRPLGLLGTGDCPRTLAFRKSETPEWAGSFKIEEIVDPQGAWRSGALP